MVEPVSRSRRKIQVLLAMLALPTGLLAHQLDEYAQSTLVAVESGRIWVELNLTPGVAVADQLLGQIDANRDDVVSTNAAATYAQRVKHDLGLRLDGRSRELSLVALNFPTPAELRTGWGIIQMEFSATPGEFSAGTHRLAFENRHRPVASVYLFNAAHPSSDAIRITGQKRNDTQSAGEIAFEVHPPQSAPNRVGVTILILAPAMLLLAGARWARKWRAEHVHRGGAPVGT